MFSTDTICFQMSLIHSWLNPQMKFWRVNLIISGFFLWFIYGCYGPWLVSVENTVCTLLAAVDVSLELDNTFQPSLQCIFSILLFEALQQSLKYKSCDSPLCSRVNWSSQVKRGPSRGTANKCIVKWDRAALLASGQDLPYHVRNS
jgi:hypothetical protein